MVEFKVGDKVQRINGYHNAMDTGDTGIVMGVRNDGTSIDVKMDKNGIFSEGHGYGNLKLISKGNGKVPKAKPVDLHIVLQDSCNNDKGKFDSYKEAEAKAKTLSEDVTIYKLVEVAKVKSTRQVKKVRSKKK